MRDYASREALERLGAKGARKGRRKERHSRDYGTERVNIGAKPRQRSRNGAEHARPEAFGDAVRDPTVRNPAARRQQA